jgi:hypothetical protein
LQSPIKTHPIKYNTRKKDQNYSFCDVFVQTNFYLDNEPSFQECDEGKSSVPVSGSKRVLRVIKILRFLKIMLLLKGIKIVE